MEENYSVVNVDDKYRIIKFNANDGQEDYIFPQILRKDRWDFIHCNVYMGDGIENIYTTKELRENFGSSHKYSFIGCHEADFAHELIKCHRMGLGAYMKKKKAEKVDWVIRHPGTGEHCFCKTFEECMDKWFEGFNIPFKCTGEIREDFKTANERVQEYLKK